MDSEDEGSSRTDKHKPIKQEIPSCVWLILLVEFCERITYYSISANLLLLCLGELELNSRDAAVIVLAFTGTSYCFPLFGSWIADTWSGKYNSILISCFLYFIGTCLFPATTYHGYDLSLKYRIIFFALGLFFVSIGSGGLKSNISSFGAEQVSKFGETAIRKFFNWFYWLINLASVLSFTLIAYLQIYSFFYGFLPALSVIFLSIVLFMCGRNYYVCVPPNGSQLNDMVQIVSYAFSRMLKHRKTVKAELPVGAELDFLDYAHVSFGGKFSSEQIDVVRCTARILLVFLSMVLFWTVYFQMPSSFLLQGEYMNLSIKSFQIPATSMNLFDSIIILLLIQFMEYCIYPCCHYFRWNFTPLRRMGLGMILATLSMGAAGLTEIYRKQNINGETWNNVSKRSFNASSTTVFLQIPQYTLIGCSEVFTSIAGLEFAYSQSPRFLQSAVMGLFLACSGLGAFLGAILITILSKYTEWFCNDINTCSMEYYYFLLAGLLFLNFLIFLIISNKYSYVENYLFGTSATGKRRGERRGRHRSSDDDSLFEHSSHYESETWDSRNSPAVGEGHI